MRWLLERRMEVIIKPHFGESESYSVSAPTRERPGSVAAWLDLQPINHRTDRPERIIGCWAELRKRRALFWRKTLATIPVIVLNSPTLKRDNPIEDILLPPMDRPQTHTVRIMGNLNGFQMPRKSELVLVFRMVGPIRKYVRKLISVRHDPKQILEPSS
jgi:hypothetical protein